MERQERVVCTEAHMGVEIGDYGWVTFGADYVPGPIRGY